MGMDRDGRARVAILYPGDEEARRQATPANNRFADLFLAFEGRGVEAIPAVYEDDLRAEVRKQLLGVDGVLVWVNPLEGRRGRVVLDELLREVAAAGVFVSTHPDVILKLGTKEVLVTTRELGWGSDAHLVGSMAQLRAELPGRLEGGRARVLKQYRGNGGDGVWKVQVEEGQAGRGVGVSEESVVTARQAKRGSFGEEMALREFFTICEPYFAEEGRMVDQEYQERLPEGMVRCYLVQGRVAGFGHQAVNALVPQGPGERPEAAPQPGPRLYFPPTLARFQRLRGVLEREWVPGAQRLLGVATADLPILWDCDFLLGPRDADGEDRYVLAEINVSSVAPYPETAVGAVVEATLGQIAARRGAG